jgi:proteasome lid subunit RPN8/RPN11
MIKPIKIESEIKKTRKQRSPPEQLCFFRYDPLQSSNDELKTFLQNHFSSIHLNDFELAFESEEKAVDTSVYKNLDVFIEKKAFEKFFLHCADLAMKNLEAMGFLLGELCEWGNSEYAIIKDAITSDLESTSISVRFRRDAFEKLFDQLDEISYDYILIGWYHSHPGFSSFMSQVDVDTQTRMFNQPFHTAVVVDPISMQLKVFRLIEDHCVEIPYAIFSDGD